MINDMDFLDLLAKIQKSEASTEDIENFYISYIDPIPVTADDFQKVKYASEHGCVDAYKCLGQAYLYGSGCEKNTASGMDLLRKSVDNKGPGSFLLGECYRTGYGVEIDFEEAYKWYDKAFKQDDAGIFRNDGLYVNPENILLRDNSADIIEISGIEPSWWEFVILKDQNVNLNSLDVLRLRFDPIQNSERYWFWTKRAAEAGSLYAKFDYGRNLLEQNDVACLPQAIQLLDDVARGEHIYSRHAIDLILSSGMSDDNKMAFLIWVFRRVDSEIARAYFKSQGRESCFDDWAELWYEDGDEEQEEISARHDYRKLENSSL